MWPLTDGSEGFGCDVTVIDFRNLWSAEGVTYSSTASIPSVWYQTLVSGANELLTVSPPTPTSTRTHTHARTHTHTHTHTHARTHAHDIRIPALWRTLRKERSNLRCVFNITHSYTHACVGIVIRRTIHVGTRSLRTSRALQSFALSASSAVTHARTRLALQTNV
jgi:hypothetical protein